MTATDMLTQDTILTDIRDRLARCIGKTTDELIAAGAKKPDGEPIDKTNGQHRNLLALWIIQRKSRVLNDDYGILVTTVRFNKKGNPREDMSIDGAFRFMERGSLLEEEWESSGDDKIAKIKRTFQKLFVLVKFQDGEDPQDHGGVTLQGSVLWRMPQSDIDGVVRPVWEKTRQVIDGGGVPERLPTSGNVSDKTCFVRDKGRGGEKGKKKTPKDGYQHPHGFYLGRDYVKKQIEEAYLRGDSGWLNISLYLVEKGLESIGEFNPDSIQDARDRIHASIVKRRGRDGFRRELLKAYGGKCAVTGCDMEEALEACHIIPYQGPETNHITNGLLLRGDIHTLFDLGEITVNTSDWTLVLGERMTSSSYADLAGTSITLPEDPSKRPSAAELNQHRFSGLPSH